MSENTARWLDIAFVAGALVRGVRRPELRRLVGDGLTEARERAAAGMAPADDAAALVDAAVGAASEAERIAAALARREARALLLGDGDYPSRLAETTDPPLLLFVRGDLPREPSQPHLAVVGSRRSSHYGREAARALAGELAAAGCVIVSGLARGVDGAAHRATLEKNGCTVAVLGCGIDVDYPREHAKLATEIVAGGGAVITELPPGSPPLAHHFPERNRIIAGLAHGVIVVEAALRSGSLSTARHALDEGREVWAVPGSIFSATSAGCLALLRDGARAAGSAADVVADLPAGLVLHLPADEAAPPSRLPTWLAATLSIEQPRAVDEIARRSERPLAEVLQALALAELGGDARSLPGGLWALSRKPNQ